LTVDVAVAPAAHGHAGAVQAVEFRVAAGVQAEYDLHRVIRTSFAAGVVEDTPYDVAERIGCLGICDGLDVRHSQRLHRPRGQVGVVREQRVREAVEKVMKTV